MTLRYRAGIIPFSINGDGIFVCLARDAESGLFGDFGGGSENKNSGELEKPSETASREAMEESCLIFSFSPEEIEEKSLFKIDNGSNTSFWIDISRSFCQMKLDELEFTSKRREIKDTAPPHWLEISEIRWMSIDDMLFSDEINDYLRKDLENLPENFFK